MGSHEEAGTRVPCSALVGSKQGLAEVAARMPSGDHFLLRAGSPG